MLLSIVEVHASYSWSAAVPNMHDSVHTTFSVIPASLVKSHGALQIYHTPNDPCTAKLILLMCKQQSSCSLKGIFLYIHCCLIILCGFAHDNKAQGPTSVLQTKQLFGCYRSKSKLWHMNDCPEIHVHCILHERYM